MGVDEVTSKWEEAAKSEQCQGHIHPTGSVGSDEYELSGQHAASVVGDVIRVYLANKGANAKVADFGCGDGRVLKYVAQDFKDCWGIDASPTMLDRLIERVPGIKTIESNGTDDSLRALKADFIYSWAVFIHHDLKTGSDMVLGLSDGLVHGGFLALQIPSYDVAKEGAAWIDVTVWTPDHLRSAAKRAGLEMVELWNSEGEFSYENIGENHQRLQIFRKP